MAEGLSGVRVAFIVSNEGTGAFCRNMVEAFSKSAARAS